MRFLRILTQSDFVRRSGECVIPFASRTPLPPFIALRSPREFFLRRLTQPRSSRSERLFYDRDFWRLPRCLDGKPSSRRPGTGAIREGFRLRRFGIHTSHRFVRRSGECVIPFASRTPLPPFIALRSPREFFLRRLTQPRSSRSERLFYDRDFWRLPRCLDGKPSSRRPGTGAIREGFRLRRFGIHTSHRFVRLSANA